MSPFDRGILRSCQPDGVCHCCGRVGSTWADCRELTAAERKVVGGCYVAVSADEWRTPPLCDTCDFAQRCWDARQFQLRHPTYGYPYMERPPRTPPVRRAEDRELGPSGWPV